MAFDEHGYICPYNENCRCMVADCDFCGWNPVVAERRLEELCESMGVKRERTQMRCIDAVDLVIKMGGRLEPLVKRRCYPRTIYAAAMQCIAAAPTIETEVTTCECCRFCKCNKETGAWKCQNRKGLFREVQPEEHCSTGRRRETHAEEHTGRSE